MLAVVVYHAGAPGVTGGFVGVDVFFVISGFLITSIVAAEISAGQFSLLSFYERRARRILPALTAVVVATVLVGWFVLLPREYEELGASAFFTTFFLSNAYFVFELDYFGTDAEFVPLLHTWSLAVEEQFYLFFPPLLALLIRWRGPKAALLGVALLSALSVLAAVLILPREPDWVFYLIFFRLWELGIGAALAMAALPAPQHKTAKDIIGSAGLLAILIPVFAYDATTDFPGLAAIPVVLGAAAIIFAGADGVGGIVNRLLARRSLVWVGLISYSLYLWHWPILAFLRIGTGQVSLPATLALAAVIGSFAIAALSYRFIERPFRARPPSGFSGTQVFALSGGMLAVMSLSGAVLHLGGGLPHRLPPDANAIAAMSGQRNADRDACFRIIPKDGLCAIGAEASEQDPVDFLLWGDSHAEAMKSGMDLAARAAGTRGVFAGSNACLPVRHIQRVPQDRRCVSINRSVWDILDGRTDIPLIVLASRWALSIEGTRYGHEAGGPVTLKWADATTAAPPATQSNAELVEAGLMATIEDLLATGRDVVLLGQTPEVGWHVPNILARRALVPWLPEPPGLNRRTFEDRAARTDAILSRIADRYDGVRYIRLSDAFCGDTRCAVTDASGRPLYTDGDHISRVAAEALLQDALSQIWEPQN